MSVIKNLEETIAMLFSSDPPEKIGPSTWSNIPQRPFSPAEFERSIAEMESRTNDPPVRRSRLVSPRVWALIHEWRADPRYERFNDETLIDCASVGVDPLTASPEELLWASVAAPREYA